MYQSPRYTSPLHIPGSPRMERGHHGERCPYPETFLTYLPGSPVKELHPQSPLRTALKVSARRALLQAPQLGPLWKEMPVSRDVFTYPSGSPAREPSPSKFPSQSSHRERHSTSRAPFNHISKSPVDGLTTGCPTEPLEKEPPPPGSPNRAPMERGAPFPGPHYFCQSSR